MQTITKEQLQKLDEAYKIYDSQSIGFLVEELRNIRRQIESGEIFSIEGEDKVLTSFADFYSWADGRYRALEDDPAVGWIGHM